MIRSTLGAIVVLLAAQAASAADLAVKAPRRAPPVAIPVYNWTGWYGGIDVGAARTDNTMTDVNGDQTVNPGDKLSYSKWGFAGGVYLGYNHQLNSNVVIGIEGDFSFATSSAQIQEDPVELDAFAKTRLHWFSTVRGRLGFLTSDRVLIYGTAGVAFAEVKNSQIDYDNGVLDPGDSPSATRVRTGWVAGAGIEWAVSDRWRVRAEYLHLDLQKTTLYNDDSVPLGDPFVYKNRIDVLRAGLTYRFGGLQY